MKKKDTREGLIVVAQRVFARLGYDGATMSDIADSSEKGRRTLYTYFRSKREVFHAVIDHEIDNILEGLDRVMQDISDETAECRLRKYVSVRMEAFHTLIMRNRALKGYFLVNISLVEKMRKRLDRYEKGIIRGLLGEGEMNGEFILANNKEEIADLFLVRLKAFELPFMLSGYSTAYNDRFKQFADVVFNGIKKN